MRRAKTPNDRAEFSRSFSQIREPRGTVAEAEAEPSQALSEARINPVETTRQKAFPLPQRVVGAADARKQPLRVLIVDDQLLVRAGICELVKALPEVAIVGEASEGNEALRLIEKLKPDLVLMDIAMPGMNGLEALVLAKKQFPRVKIIILSEHSNEEFVFRALRSGAEGFVLKDDSVGELFIAIASVARGGEHLSPQVTGKVVSGYLESQVGHEVPLKSLTRRQREILQHIAEGKSTKEIASRLDVSVNTVKTHRLKLMEKLGVHEISGVVRYAARSGLIEN